MFVLLLNRADTRMPMLDETGATTLHDHHTRNLNNMIVGSI